MGLRPVPPFRDINCLLITTAGVNQQHRTLAIRSGPSAPYPAVSLRHRDHRAKSGAPGERLLWVTVIGSDGWYWTGLDRPPAILPLAAQTDHL